MNHFAWEVAYRDAAIFKLLAGIKRDPFPNHVIYRTYSLRYNQAYWLRIDGIEHGLAMAEIEGDRTDGQFTVRVGNVSAFSLLLDPKRVPADRADHGRRRRARYHGPPRPRSASRGPPRPVLSFARAGADVDRSRRRPPATARGFPIMDRAASSAARWRASGRTCTSTEPPAAPRSPRRTGRWRTRWPIGDRACARASP